MLLGKSLGRWSEILRSVDIWSCTDNRRNKHCGILFFVNDVDAITDTDRRTMFAFDTVVRIDRDSRHN